MKKLIICLLCNLAICLSVVGQESGTTVDVSEELRDQNTPTGWNAVQLPQIPEITASNTFNITSYGASTSSEDNAAAINSAIAAANTAGGGMVIIPAGTWLSGPITMKSKVVLHLKAGTTLKMLEFGKYPDNTEHEKSYSSGFAYKDYTFIGNGNSAVDDVIIEGEGETSVIDGQGAPWWEQVELAKANSSSFDRPACIRFKKGTRHLFRNFKTQNTPGVNITIGNKTKTGHVTIHDVWISNPDSEASSGASHNTDGIPIWEPYVNIYNCNISTGDDNIVVDSEGHHIHAWNINCGYGHGMSVGSYTVNVHDVIYEGVTFSNTGSGFRIKTNADRSGNDQTGSNGAVKNLICRNATMTGCPSPIKITSWYDKDVENPSSNSTSTVTETTPEFCNILFQNITETTGKSGATSWKHNRPVYLYGRPEMPVHDITLDNVNINSYLGMFIAFAKNITFKNGCKITNKRSSSSLLTTEYQAYSDDGSTLISANPNKYNGSETATTYAVKFMNGSTVYKTYNICPNSYAYPPAAPTKSGATFKGWATTSGGTPVTLAQTELAAGGTFYAVWDGESGDSEDSGTEETTTLFSLTSTATSSVNVDPGKDQDLSSYATITGGSALIHNGHSSTASTMIKSSGFTFGNSGGSYIKLTLNTALKSGDVLTTTGGDGGLVSTASSTTSSDNISSNKFTFTSDYEGKTEVYICRGSSKPTITGITITRTTTSGGSSDPETPSGSTVTGTETTPTQKTSNEDAVGLCYTIPATYVGGQGNSSKAIKFNVRNDVIVINVNPNYTITGFTFTGNDNYNTNGITISSVTVDGGSTNVLGSSTTFATDKSENSFTVSNINATDKITITASTPHDNQLNGTIVFTYKYNVQKLALQSSAKTSGRNGSVTLKFNNPMAASTATATLNGKSLSADVDGTTVKFIYTGLDYGQSYTFSLPANSLKDEYDQTYSEAVSLTITTDARATVTKQGFDKVVSTAQELAEAIKAANNRSDKTTRYRIFCKPGVTYQLPTQAAYQSGTGATTKTVTVTLSDGTTQQKTYDNPTTYLEAANVSIIGADYSTTTITNSIPTEEFTGKYGTANIAEGIGNGDVLQISKNATGSYFQGVTIKTSMGDAKGRDIAVNDQSNKTIMKDVCLWGYQDTYVSNNSNGRFYFDGGVLRGRTDYLCGKGDVYYNKVTLQQCGTGGYLAVPSVPTKYGYIFNECYIKKETSDVTYYLGRPWGSGTPIALFINTKVDAAPIAAGWAEMSGGWPARFAEYNTKTTSGSSVSTSSRKTTFNSSYTNNPVLTQTEAEYYSNMARVMGGSDGWDPTEYTEQCAKPTASLSGTTLSWTDDSHASSWIVFKDGEYYANPITNSLALTESGTYTVRAANAMGGLGEASEGKLYSASAVSVSSVIVSPANKTLAVDATLQLYAQVLPTNATDKSVTWSVEEGKSSVAEVSAEGLVTAKAAGTVKIYATANDGSDMQDYCMVTVIAKQTTGSSSATFYPSDFTSKTGSKTKEGVTLNISLEGYNDRNHGNTMKCKSNGNTLAFSSEVNITSIVLNCNSDYSSNITRIKATPSVGSVTKNTDDYKYSWTGNSKNVTITFEREEELGSDQSVYVSSIDVVTASTITTECITKHISSSTWASFVPEKSVVVPEDVKVYYIKSGSYNSTAKTVHAVEIATGTVIKGDGTNTYGYIVNADKEGDYQFKVSSEGEQTYSDNILACGKNEPIAVGSLVFACYDNTSGFYALDSYAINLPVGIVYLPASVLASSGSAPRAVTIMFDDATGIHSAENYNFWQTGNGFYNINGQKVDANYKGIVIRNGRKYINK